MKLISLDPSGNFGREGAGTTGIAIMENGVITDLHSIHADKYLSELAYWDAIVSFLEMEFPDHVVFEGYKLYNHRGKSATIQANSELQTPQLIGVLKYHCFRYDIPFTVQFASDVKTRWSEDVLERLGHLEKRGKNYYFNGKLTSTHKRDAMKHALHCWRYKIQVPVTK